MVKLRHVTNLISAPLATVAVFFTSGLAMSQFCAFKWADIRVFGKGWAYQWTKLRF